MIIEENEFKLLSIEVIYMNAKDMGVFICKLRKENNMKQMEWAEKIHITDKAISRWKRGIGFLDIQLLPSLTKLISCKKSSYYSNEEVTNIICNLEVYKKKCFRQDRTVDKIALVCMIFVVACVYLYYVNSSKRIYVSFSLLRFLIFWHSISLWY